MLVVNLNIPNLLIIAYTSHKILTVNLKNYDSRYNYVFEVTNNCIHFKGDLF